MRNQTWSSFSCQRKSLLAIVRKLWSTAFVMATLLYFNLGVATAGCISGQCVAPSLIWFSPGDGTTFAASQNITVSGRAYGDVLWTWDAEQYIFPISRVDIYRDGVVVGQATLGPRGYTDDDIPYNDFSYTFVGGLPPGAHTVGAKPFDTGSNAGNASGIVTTASITVSPPPNVPPSVMITQPANGTTFMNGSSVGILVGAWDDDGSVTRVEIYDGGSIISTRYSPPYSATLVNPATGTHTLTAKAYDNSGAISTSGITTINIAANSAPTVTITSPSNGATFAYAANVPISASATDVDGTIGKVEIYDGSTLLGTVFSPPYSVTLTQAQAGTHVLTAKAYDNSGAISTSAVTTINIAANSAPAVAITSPSSGATFAYAANIPITASATDADGVIGKVEIYDGSTLLGTVLSAPYSATLTQAQAGTHILTAKAYDNYGLVNTSSISISVAEAPPPPPPNVVVPGTTAGVLNVDGNGSATYSLPIVAPPGTAGLMPKVGLSYDSATGNGIAGVGWSVAGLSQIARCARDFSRDGFRAGVDLTINDRFCLDGQRLVLVAGSYYGAANSEYRTEINNYAKIVALGVAGNGPSSFLVTLRDGSKLEYGNTDDSRWTLPGHSTPLVWGVNRFSDARTNYYTVTYTTVAGTGQQLPSRIDYTGNVAQTTSPYNSIRFSYDQTRPDTRTAYFVGQKVTASSRLNSIQTYAGTGLVKEYRIAYDVSTPTGRSRIQSVTECADATTCLSPTVFNWANEPTNFNGSVITYGTPSEEFGALMKGDPGKDYWPDLNGDGKPDHCKVTRSDNLPDDLICSITQPGGGVLPVKVGFAANGTGFNFVDVDGDGITDVCTVDSCFYANATRTAWTQVMEPPAVYSPWDIESYVDLNGDGRQDFCRLVWNLTAGKYALNCYMGTPSGFSAAVNLGDIQKPWCDAYSCDSVGYEWVDVSGDGVPSLCSLEINAVRCRKWTPNGLAAPISITSFNLGESNGGRSWHDANGDGISDFCRVIANSPGQLTGNGYIACTLSTGAGFGDTIISGTIDVGNSQSSRWWVDVNGDGLPDFCRHLGNGVGTGVSCLRATGTGFSGEIVIASDYPEIADANGDGRKDFCAPMGYPPNNVLKCFTGAGVATPDILIDVTDGLGAYKSLSYKPISDSSVYTKGSGSVYPINDVQDSSIVVQRVRTSNGIGGFQDTTYTYEGAKVNLHGRGSMGFAATTIIEPAGSVTKTSANQTFPYTGLTSRVETSYAGVTTLDKVISYDATSSAPYSVVEVKTVNKTYDLDGSFINWVEGSTPATSYDAWGNPLEIDTIYKDVNGVLDGYSQKIVSTYLNDTVNWIFGLTTNWVMTSRVPGKADSVRTLASSYYTTNPGLGKIKQGIVEPNNGGLGVTNLRLVTDYAYDNFGNPFTKQVSAANTVTRVEMTHTYDALGRGPKTSMNALNQLESMEFDWRFGTISSQTGPNLLTTVFGVDKFGRSTGETRPNGTRTTLTYNFCAGCVQDAVYNIERTETLAATGAQVAPTTRTYFDTLGREIHRVTVGFSGQEIHSAITFNGLGQAETASRNYSPGQTNIGLTQYEYDGAGRRKKMTFPDNSYFTYTFNGRTKLVANTNGVTASQRSNSQGQLIEKIDAVSTSVVSSVLYEYDNWNNLSKTTDAMGNSIVTTYDLLGRKTRQVDPDLGTWDYVINNLGQVTSQKDAKLQNTVFTYDLLGRLTSREEADLTSSWYYEKNAAGVACSMGVGKLCEATASNGYFRRLTYDSLGRKSLQTSHIDTDYLTDWTYDTAGRLSTETFPAAVPGNRLRLNYNYSPLGWLANVTNNATGVAYWTRNAENSDGDITAETFGNGLIGTRSYDPVSGRIAGIKLGTAATPGSVQDQSYHFDILGRMDSRQDNTTGIGASETFGYDRLNRLSTVSFVAPGVGSQSSTVTYDAIGNILTKTGVGTYAYPLARSARPHAVSGVTGTVNGVSNPAYTYDDNGNMLTGGARNFTWTSFNMPATLTKIAQAGSPGAGTSTFLYGAEHQRVKQTWSGAGKTITTTYVDGGNFEKEVDSATGLTAAKHYVVADGRVVAIHTSNSNATEDVRYLSSDHLGSTTVVTAASGTVMERQAFDPWGDRRTATGSQAGASDPTNSIQPTGTSRGFTGHEHLDQGNMGLVHTNGRIYDPTLGRFLSPDPFVQSADFTQSYNRYSYIWNSPLNGVDPTGYVADDAGSVTVSGRAWAAADGGDWSVVCRGSGCEGLFAPSQWIESRVTQLMSKGKEVTVLMGKNGRARLLISNFETTTLNDGVTQGVRETRASEDEPRYYGTSDEIVGQWCDFELFSRLALDAGVPKPYADNIGLIALIGNPKNGLSKLAKLAKLKPSQLHHICTDKFCISLRRGGPWTPRFKDIFKGAGMKLDDALNKVLVAGHKGPHPEEYHTYVYDTLLRELRGKSGEEYKETLQKTLVRLGEEISTPGTYLNGLVRNPK